MYEKLKNNDNIYNLTITEYLRLGDISSKESYNINLSYMLLYNFIHL